MWCESSFFTRLPGKSFQMKRVTFELSDDLHKKLKLLCYTEGVSIGHILRECVSDFCNKHDAHLIELIDHRSK